MAHLADILQKIGIIESRFPPSAIKSIQYGLMETNEPTDESVGVRDQFVLQFAEILALDQNLWRIELEYLISCGAEGRRRTNALLTRVAAGEGGDASGPAVGGMVIEREGKSDGEGKEVLVTEVLEICAQLGMEELAREICQVSFALRLISSWEAYRRY